MNTTKKECHTLLAKHIGAWIKKKFLQRKLPLNTATDEARLSWTHLSHHENRRHRGCILFGIFYALECIPDEIAELFEIDAEVRMSGVS